MSARYRDHLQWESLHKKHFTFSEMVEFGVARNAFASHSDGLAPSGDEDRLSLLNLKMQHPSSSGPVWVIGRFGRNPGGPPNLWAGVPVRKKIINFLKSSRLIIWYRSTSSTSYSWNTAASKRQWIRWTLPPEGIPPPKSLELAWSTQPEIISVTGSFQ